MLGYLSNHVIVAMQLWELHVWSKSHVIVARLPLV